MKIKLALTISIMFLGTICNSQDLIEIKGTVSSPNSRDGINLVKNAEIIINKSDGSSISTMSNDSGQYYFKVEAFNGTGKIFIQTSKKTTSVNDRGLSFLASKESYTMDLSQKKIYIKDFSVSQVIICYSFPSILFKNNSTETYWQKNQAPNALNNETPDEAISLLYKALTDDPSIVIRLSGNCNYNENNKDSLSLARANYVGNELIKKGIPKERIITKGLSDSRLLVKCEIIKKAKTADEKEALRQKNRRVVFSIDSWDYRGK